MKINLGFLKPQKKFKKGGFHTNPNIGWGLVLAVSLGLIILVLLFGGKLYFATRAEYSPEEAQNGSQIKIVKKERIQKVLEYFQLREEKSKEVLISPSPVIDPSL